MNELCKHAKPMNDGENGNKKYLLCDSCNEICTFYRWCITDKCFKMLPRYNHCKYNIDKPKEEVKEKKTKSKSIVLEKEYTSEFEVLKED